MAESKKPPKTAPIMDVSKPGKSAPSPTSRAIIVNHQPMVSDPMVIDESAKSELGKGPGMVLPKTDKTSAEKSEDTKETEEAKPDEIANDSEKPEEPEQTPDDDEKSKKDSEPAPAADEPADKTDDSKEGEETKPAESPDQDDKPDDEATDEAETKDPSVDEKAELEKQAKHDAEIQKLVDSKTYFLPINVVERRRSRQVVVMGIVLCIVLAVVWVDIALDAGLIKIGGLKSVTHFFSN